ncbi:MAG: 50S ribosomal protein L11 methyltransferase [Tenuifilaceae bacterium]
MDYIELKIKVEPSNQEVNEILIAQLAEIGFESFTEEENGFGAFIKAIDFNETISKSIKELIIPEGSKVTFLSEKIPDQNWNVLWESNFEPIIVDNRCLVRASFHQNTPKLDYEIIIDPKMAFGTGHHQTTHLMIDAIIKEDFSDKTVLDMGCGTGVLAILAEMKGAKKVTAIDIDEWAYRSTDENIILNNCKKIDPYLGDVSLIKEKKFDIVLANINLNILISDMKFYYNSLLPSGTLIVSGILKKDIPAIIQKSTELGLSHLDTITRDEWVMISFRKQD